MEKCYIIGNCWYLYPALLTTELIPHFGLKDKKSLWPDGVVPYYIRPEHFTSEEEDIILHAFEEFHKKTCIRFRPYKKGDENYVVVQGLDKGCWSRVGRQYNLSPNVINLKAPDCIDHATVVHELMHTIGFEHEQSTPDRDKWVTIYWRNIIEGEEYNFEQYDSSTMIDFGISYDYDSIMHYNSYAFSNNGAPTILPKMPNAQIGNAKNLSEKDIVKVNKMYKHECALRKLKEKKLGQTDSDHWSLS